MPRKHLPAKTFKPVVPAGAPAPTDPPMTWGYARVSTLEQTTAPQVDALGSAGVPASRVISEQISGAVPGAAWPGLAGLLSVLRRGDPLAAARLDRLGRDPADVLSPTRDLDRRGVRLRLLDLGADTGTPSGRVLLAVLAAVAGSEREILIERTRDGLSAAKSRGQALGRRRSLSAPQRQHAVELATAGHSIREIGRRLGCSASIAHRAIMEGRGGVLGAVSEVDPS